MRLLSSARRRTGSQAGLTLVEVLLTIAISGIIAIPVLAWMVTGFKTEQVVKNASNMTRASNQLNQHFTRDMSSASLVTIAGSNCAAAPATDTVLVSMLSHDMSKLVVYAGVTGDAAGQLVRRVCPAAGGPVDEEQTLLENVALPLASNLTATPATIPSRPGDPAARVDLTVKARDGAVLRVTGSRRTGSDT